MKDIYYILEKGEIYGPHDHVPDKHLLMGNFVICTTANKYYWYTKNSWREITPSNVPDELKAWMDILK